MSLFLSRDELCELTGCKRRDKVASWLREAGYRHEIAADGWPRVLRAAVEARLMPAGGRRQPSKSEPDFSAYGPPKKAA